MVRNRLTLPFSGARLREWRERAGLTQQDLAGKCGLSRFQISRWETGEAKPAVRALEPLVRGLGTALGRDGFTLDDLLDAPANGRLVDGTGS
ncbi:helix-turn-helix domain-containing protein [Actinocrispum wychmicini]|uniref:Helix-turn-helix protein n=1 Tax=Actinocrispum wychmicini TaxID=1213861 RepID=A0A4R2K977_9PSEU|nr:helix-turn-helix transcriptional regulator [Actinocrispum wychmicini]TCO62955.1 helix-turn-helix protein [Actinocrispum wychmicini]